MHLLLLQVELCHCCCYTYCYCWLRCMPFTVGTLHTVTRSPFTVDLLGVGICDARYTLLGVTPLPLITMPCPLILFIVGDLRCCVTVHVDDCWLIVDALRCSCLRCCWCVCCYRYCTRWVHLPLCVAWVIDLLRAWTLLLHNVGGVIPTLLFPVWLFSVYICRLFNNCCYGGIAVRLCYGVVSITHCLWLVVLLH